MYSLPDSEVSTNSDSKSNLDDLPHSSDKTSLRSDTDTPDYEEFDGYYQGQSQGCRAPSGNGDKLDATVIIFIYYVRIDKPYLALDHNKFPRCSKKGPNPPAKLLVHVENLVHTLDERVVLTHLFDATKLPLAIDTVGYVDQMKFLLNIEKVEKNR